MSWSIKPSILIVLGADFLEKFKIVNIRWWKGMDELWRSHSALPPTLSRIPRYWLNRFKTKAIPSCKNRKLHSPKRYVSKVVSNSKKIGYVPKTTIVDHAWREILKTHQTQHTGDWVCTSHHIESSSVSVRGNAQKQKQNRQLERLAIPVKWNYHHSCVFEYTFKAEQSRQGGIAPTFVRRFVKLNGKIQSQLFST